MDAEGKKDLLPFHCAVDGCMFGYPGMAVLTHWAIHPIGLVLLESLNIEYKQCRKYKSARKKISLSMTSFSSFPIHVYIFKCIFY